MAGPGERAWRFTDDPAHAWIRETWEDQAIDPRLPLTGAAEEDRMRLTVAQALVRFLGRPAHRARRRRAAASSPAASASSATATSPGSARRCSSTRDLLPYHPARNEQAMVHVAAGYARQRNRLGDVRLHDLGRPGRDEHGHRRGAGDDQPPAGAAAARRHVRDAHAAPGAAAARGPARRDGVGQRLLPAGVALLRPHRARPSSSSRPRSRRCACSPTRPRPAR